MDLKQSNGKMEISALFLAAVLAVRLEWHLSPV